MNNTHKTTQQGLSLVELMIALAIGCFLILGITQIFIDNKRSYVFQQSQAKNIESARFAELLLNEYLSKTGYRRGANEPVESAFPETASNTDCAAFTAGSPITASADRQGICIRYQPVTSREPDCEGNASTAFEDEDAAFPEVSTNSLIVLAIKYIPAGASNAAESTLLESGSIRCKSLNSAGSTGYVELLDGVADFRLDFGVGPKDLFSKTLRKDGDRFVRAADWSVNTGPIRVVRYSILLASTENQRDGDSKAFDDWYAKADAPTKSRLSAGDKGRTYQTASSTQNLRNLMP